MRVLHVTDTFLPKIGGAEIAIDQLVRAMNALPNVQCAVLAQTARHHAGPVNVPYPLYRFRNPQSARWAGWWIRRHIARLEKRHGPFDVLIGHHAFPPGYACVKNARKTRRPAIIYPRGGDIYEVSRFRKKPGAWKKLSWALANASAVVCASTAMAQIVQDIIGLSAAHDRIAKIPNGVNLADLQSDSSTSRFYTDERFQSPFILALGRLIRRKGFHLLIEAFIKTAKPDWKLVIAGEGRELQALQSLAAPHADKIIFTGLVQNEDKNFLLQHCQFMAAPSLEEAFGNVALEAMACAKPVVASNASGFAEIVRHNHNGLLVDLTQPTALHDALTACMTQNLAPMSQAAAQTAIDFSWPVIARRYLQLIEKVRSDA